MRATLPERSDHKFEQSNQGSAIPIQDRLIVALDVESITQARMLVSALDGVVSFYKIGFWLLFQPDVNSLIDDLISSGRKLFLDTKLYDIGETVRRGVASVAARGVSFVTVHGDPEIMKAAVDGRGDSALKVFAVSVLTSLDDSGLRAMGYGLGVQDLVGQRVRAAAACRLDGVIASPTDNPDQLRIAAGAPSLLVTTPGVRLAEDATHDHARVDTPDRAIEAGADYLVVGRPIIHAPCPATKARAFIARMEAGARARHAPITSSCTTQ